MSGLVPLGATGPHESWSEGYETRLLKLSGNRWDALEPNCWDRLGTADPAPGPYVGVNVVRTRRSLPAGLAMIQGVVLTVREVPAAARLAFVILAVFPVR